MHCSLVKNKWNDISWDVLAVAYVHQNIYNWYVVQHFHLLDNMKECNFTPIINFKITNEVNEEIDFNGIDISFTISFFKYNDYIVYKLNDYINYETFKKK